MLAFALFDPVLFQHGLLNCSSFWNHGQYTQAPGDKIKNKINYSRAPKFTDCHLFSTPMPLSPLISCHIIPFALKLLYASLRISVLPRPTELPGKGAIITFWHGKMITGWLLAQTLFPGKKIAAVVSMSEDGKTLADTLERLGFTLIRGSSSKGGDAVKLAMQKALQNGDIVALTPDGPRGPANQFKFGTLRLASEKRFPLVFADIHHEKTWKLKSWDQFEIPKPFSKTTIQLHLIDLPVFKNEEEVQSYTKQLSIHFGHA
jgi:hypothetical protein